LVFGSLRFVRTFRILLSSPKRALIEPYYTRAKELKNFLDQFVPQYTTMEIQRHKTFFDGKSFDREQVEAIVKRDRYNLVIAGAGSGKTRALTGRIAFLIECGASADEILALAYTKSAGQEVRQRLRDDYGISSTEIRTFHSLGFELARCLPNARTGVADKPVQEGFISDSIKQLSLQDRRFAILLLHFATDWQAQESGPNEFEDVEKYYEYLRNQKYITLNRKEVRSIPERDIANFLFLNGVKFEYEPISRWADRDVEFRQYRPDFYLPEYGIWLEHWAVDGAGKVPPWFSAPPGNNPSEYYRKGMEWKRGQYKKYGRKLLETYQHQWKEGTLDDDLRLLLEVNHVIMKEMTKEEILERIRNLMPREDHLNELILSFITRAKTNGLTMGDINSRLAQPNWDRTQRSFAQLMIPIWEKYESLLEENDMMDFADMINYALQYAGNGNTRDARRYSHILIDEFQDITDPQLELVKCLLDREAGSTLFCVGDDRQNIFSFAGSNINNILHFDTKFLYAEKTIFSTNYRCPRNIVEASDTVANLNKSKIDRTIASASSIWHPIRLFEMKNLGTFQNYEEWERHAAKVLLEELLADKKQGETIMVLARNNQSLDRLKWEFPNNESLGLSFLTIHGAKGTEADYVLLLGCVSGRNGFPSEVIDQEVLEIVNKDRPSESDKLEEERRLFYVALTRCKNQFFLFTSKEKRSQFVSEIESYLLTK
jgi:DNA helicase IV